MYVGGTDMENEVQELLKALEKVNSLMTKENLRKATTEELLKRKNGRLSSQNRTEVDERKRKRGKSPKA